MPEKQFISFEVDTELKERIERTVAAMKAQDGETTRSKFIRDAVRTSLKYAEVIRPTDADPAAEGVVNVTVSK